MPTKFIQDEVSVNVNNKWIPMEQFQEEASRHMQPAGWYEFRDRQGNMELFFSLSGSKNIQDAIKNIEDVIKTSINETAVNNQKLNVTLQKFVQQYNSDEIKQFLIILFLKHIEKPYEVLLTLPTPQGNRFRKVLGIIFNFLQTKQFTVDAHACASFLHHGLLEICVNNKWFKPDVNAIRNGYTPLLLVFKSGFLDRLAYWINLGSDINFCGPCGTFLHINLANEKPLSLIKNNLITVQKASKQPFNFALQDSEGKTPLYI